MKTFNKIVSFAVLLGSILLLPSCKDNILTPVANNKSADSLTALINTLNTKLVSVNAKDNTLQIQIAKFQSKADSLKAISNGNGNYSQLVQYTIYIIDGSNSVTGVYWGERTCKDCKVAGVDGATVTVYSNGQMYTSVSADGRAIFNNLYVAGLATVTISATGYTRCSYTTYFNPSYSGNGSTSQTGSTINASTNVLLLPTAGKNVSTFTGQLYINNSTMDDTVGRLYNKPADVALYKTFISPNGPYHGTDFTTNPSTPTTPNEYTQNQYYNISNGLVPPGQGISFTGITNLSKINYLYGYPTFVSTYYSPNNLNYQYLPGDIISISYSGLTAFADINATGSYRLTVPAYANNPGTIISVVTGLENGNNGNPYIHYQDTYTYLTTTNYAGSTNPTLNSYDPTSEVVTKVTNYYEVSTMFQYYPYIETDDGSYSAIDDYTQSFNTLPGQTVTRNIFFFATVPTGL